MDLDQVLTTGRFYFTITGLKYQTAVQRFSVEEAISECYLVKLWLVSEDQIDPEEVLEKEALLALTGQDENRNFHGVISQISLTGQDGRFYLYQAHLVPSFWFLSLNSDFRIFQEKTVVEIADEMLKAGTHGGRHVFRLVNDYHKRRYCAQYGESDWQFVCRLLEEEGIFYFFEHSQDKHVLVIADGTVAYASIAGESDLQYHLEDGMVPEKETVSRFVFSRSIRPGKVTQTSYNFKRPSLDLTVQQQRESHRNLDVYEYPGNYGYQERGDRMARIRLEEKRTLREFAEGTSNCRRFVPGCTFTLTDHDFYDLNTTYLLIRSMHKGTQSHVLAEQSGIGGDCSYFNEFLAIPAKVMLRPERILTKPHVKGLQSAIVVGPPGEEIYPDEYGRVKVQFHWDREGQHNERSSCWLRISQPWSGQSWGVINIPRVGDEVLVDFINGDPDWPIIVGSVNNADSPALYHLPADKTRSGIRTRSYPRGGHDNFHELRFDDRKGSEEIYLQSEKDWNILVKHDKAQNVGHDEALHVGSNRLKTVGVDQMVQVGANHTEKIGANKSVSVGANKRETVGMNSAENVGLAKELSTGGLYQVTVGAAMNETVIGAKTEEVGITKLVMVKGDMTEKVFGNRHLTVDQDLSATVSKNTCLKAQSIIFEATDEIVFKAGGATISLKSSGDVVITGATITEKAGGEIVIKGSKTLVN